MKIERVYIDGFGILSDLEIDMSGPSLVVVFGDNEAGKSSLCEFIRFVLFGARKDLRKIYEPVKGGRYGGLVEISTTEGRRYVIERYIVASKTKEEVRVQCTSNDGDAVDLSGNLAAISRSFYDEMFGFDLTDISQLSTLSFKDTMKRAITKGSGVKIEKIEEFMKLTRQAMDELYKPQGSRPEVNLICDQLINLDEERTNLEESLSNTKKAYADLDVANSDLENNRKILSKLKNDLKKVSDAISSLKEEQSNSLMISERNGIDVKRHIRNRIVSGVTGAILLIFAILSKKKHIFNLNGSIETACAVIGSILLFISVIFGLIVKRKKDELVKFSSQIDLIGLLDMAKRIDNDNSFICFKQYCENKEEASELNLLGCFESQEEKLNACITEINRVIDEQNRYVGKLEGILSVDDKEEFTRNATQIESLKVKLKDACTNWAENAVARSLVERSYVDYSNNLVPKAASYVAQYLKSMTCLSYTSIISLLNEDDSIISLSDKYGSSIEFPYLSAGTKDQVYISFRLGLIELYFENNESLPITMDDCLINFDNCREEAAIRILSDISASGTIIYFTCHEHMLERFKEICDDVTLIRMECGKVI